MFKVYRGSDVRLFQPIPNDVHPIGEIDHTPDVYEHLNLDGKTFVIQSIHHKEQFCTAAEIVDFQGDTEYETDMICPWCGHAQSDAWELSEDDSETDCGTCGKTFKYLRDVEVTYSTQRVTT